MKRWSVWVMVFIAAAGLAAAEPTSENDPRLRKALERFPQADANGDGVLTLSEAKAAQKKAAQLRNKKPAARGDEKKRLAPTLADVKYGPHQRNVLDFYQAKSDSPTPLIVYIHGGGFTGGDKKGVSQEVVRKCLDSGVSVAAIHYRFLPDARIAEILRDSARALQFMRFKANEWNIDKKRVASYGGSAGAGTSLWLAAHDDLADPKNADPVLRESTRLTAAGSLNGQFTYDFRKWEEVLGKDPDKKYEDGERDKLYRQWYGLSPAEVEQAGPKAAAVLADADMQGMLTKDDPPLFVYCPGNNTAPENHGHYIHHPRHSIAIKEKCDAVGVECELALKANDPNLSGDAANEQMLKFFFKHLNVK